MSQETASYWQSPSSREKLSQKFPQFCRKRLNRAWTYLRCDRKLQRQTQTNVLQPKRYHQLAFPGMLSEFSGSPPYPNHRARNPHPGDGLDPLLGPRIFRALRLGPFEGFPDGIDVEANND